MRFKPLLPLFAAVLAGWPAWMFAQDQERIARPTESLINDLTPEFEAAQERRREHDRAEDAAVLSAILREDLAKLYSSDPHAQAEQVGQPLTDYLPGYGIVAQISVPPPYLPEAGVATGQADETSRWEAMRRRLRGEASHERLNWGANCQACHDVTSRADAARSLRALYDWSASVDPHHRLGVTFDADHPTTEQIIAALVRLLADNGRHLRHLQPDERITLSVHYTPAPQPATSSETAESNISRETKEEAERGAAGATPHRRELAGDLLFKQGKYAEAERAYREALQEQRKTHPQGSSLDELIAKMLAASVEKGFAESGGEATDDDEMFLRRVYLDLLGVLPPPAEREAFLADRSPERRTKLIHRLLERPEFLQHWARRWKAIYGDDASKSAPDADAQPGDLAELRNAIDRLVLHRYREIAPPPRSMPLSGRISVTATKRQVDAVAAGALTREEFQKHAIVRVFAPAATGQ